MRHVALPRHDGGLHELARLIVRNSPRTSARDRRPATRGDGDHQCSCPTGDRIATSTIANMKDGMVWKNSVTRISSVVDEPP